MGRREPEEAGRREVNESKGVVGVLVLAGVFFTAHSVAAGDVSALSVQELKERIEAGEARIKAAVGKYRSVTVRGGITDHDEHLLYVLGSAWANNGNPYGFGIHTGGSCLMVQNPKGLVFADTYFDRDLFYLGEGRAKNSFGVSIPCSIYGGFDELPADIRAAVKKAYLDFQPLKAELDRRLEPERKAAKAVESKRAERIRQIDARLAELTTQRKEIEAQLGKGRSSAAENRVMAPIGTIYQEEQALYKEKQALEKGLDPEKERAKEAAKKEAERSERRTELLDLKRDLEGVRSSLAEADGRCKSARARLMEATRSQSMGRGTTDEEINRVAREETSTCNERSRLSAKKVVLENDIRRMGGGAADESTAMAAAPTPATEVHSTNPTIPSVGSSIAPTTIATRSPAEEALDRGDWPTAYAAYTPRADAGDSDAQVRLGVMYYDALGRKQDFVLAESWFRKAAQRGSAEAKYRLALLFSEGRKGAPWDLEAAHRFLAESAPTYPEAAYKLGRFYWDGIGVPEDRIKGREWIEKAAAKGDSSAIDWISSHK